MSHQKSNRSLRMWTKLWLLALCEYINTYMNIIVYEHGMTEMCTLCCILFPTRPQKPNCREKMKRIGLATISRCGAKGQIQVGRPTDSKTQRGGVQR